LKKRQLQPAIDLLPHHSSKVSTSAGYTKHLCVRLQTLDVMKVYAQAKARVTVKQCTSCKTLLSRDVSAACVILDIFEFQRQERTTDLPAFVSR
jgi:hypothetical protein